MKINLEKLRAAAVVFDVSRDNRAVTEWYVKIGCAGHRADARGENRGIAMERAIERLAANIEYTLTTARELIDEPAQATVLGVDEFVACVWCEAALRVGDPVDQHQCPVIAAANKIATSPSEWRKRIIDTAKRERLHRDFATLGREADE